MAFQVITALWMVSQIGQVASPPINVRVAIVAYEDFHSEMAKYEELFSQLSRHDPAFHFQIAVGSYGEVVHWIDRQTVDLAILTPGIFASLLSNSNGTTHSPRCQYLATIQLPAARSK